MSGRPDNYLDPLPPEARRPGDHRQGEIELIPDMSADEAGTGSLEVGVVYEDAYVCIVRDRVRFPSGRSGYYIRIFETADLTGRAGAVVIPVRDRRILFRWGYRHATRGWELEVPRGMRKAEADTAAVAREELLQEMGLTARRIDLLGSVLPNSGLLASVVDVFAAWVEGVAQPPAPEESEALGRFEELEWEEVLRRIAAGELRDGLSISALMLFQARGCLAEGGAG